MNNTEMSGIIDSVAGRREENKKKEVWGFCHVTNQRREQRSDDGGGKTQKLLTKDNESMRRENMRNQWLLYTNSFSPLLTEYKRPFITLEFIEAQYKNASFYCVVSFFFSTLVSGISRHCQRLQRGEARHEGRGHPHAPRVQRDRCLRKKEYSLDQQDPSHNLRSHETLCIRR